MIRNSCRVRESGARACAAYVPRFRGCDRNKSRVTFCKSKHRTADIKRERAPGLCGAACRASLSYSCLIRYRDVCVDRMNRKSTRRSIRYSTA